MKLFAAGCFAAVAQWVLYSWLLYHYLLLGPFSPPGDLIGSIVGGFLCVAGVSAVWRMFEDLRDARLLSVSNRRVTVPRDGERVVAAGKLELAGTPLRSPIFEKPCAGYEYDVSLKRVVRTKKSGMHHVELKIINGYAIAPCALRTNVFQFRILGFPFLDELPEEHAPVIDRLEAVRSYCSSTTFKDMTGWRLAEAAAELSTVLRNRTGEMRSDWKLREVEGLTVPVEPGEEGLDLSEVVASEHRLEIGGSYCVLGKYQSNPPGIVQSLANRGLEVIPGTLEEVMRRLRVQAVFKLVVGIVCVILGTAGTYGGLTIRERSSGLAAQNVAALKEALKNDSLDEVRKLLRRGVSPNTRNANDGTLVRLARSPSALRLLVEFGGDISTKDEYGFSPLHAAVKAGDVRLVEALLGAGANVNDEQSGWRRTPLDIAVEARNRPIIELLRKAGGHAGLLEPEEGEALPADGGEPYAAVLELYAAARAQRIEDLNAVVDGWPEDYAKHVRSGDWASAKPTSVRFLRGWVSGDRATVLVAGRTRSGHAEQWLYSLVRRNGRWLVRSESWDSELRW